MAFPCSLQLPALEHIPYFATFAGVYLTPAWKRVAARNWAVSLVSVIALADFRLCLTKAYFTFSESDLML